MTFQATAEQGNEKTGLAAFVAVIAVLPAIIPAGIAVMIYGFFFSRYLGTSWIPYVDEIGGIVFPEMVRGLTIGAAAMWISRYFFPRSNIEAVRFAVLAFWGAVSLLIIVASIYTRGLHFDLIGMIAMVAGLIGGLWAVD